MQHTWPGFAYLPQLSTHTHIRVPSCRRRRYALPTQYDQMRRSMARLWQAQQPVVEAACAELQVGSGGAPPIRLLPPDNQLAIRSLTDACDPRSLLTLSPSLLRPLPPSPPLPQAKLTSDPYLQARVASVVVEAQRKSLYSTWRKLDAAGKAPKELGDIAQLRVVLTPLPPGAEGAVPPALDYG